MILELLLGPLCRDPTFYHDYCDKWDLCKVLDPGAQVPIKEDEDDEEGISEDYHMVVREPTLPLSYPYNSMLLPPLSPSPPPTSITFYLNVWGGNLPGQPDPASNITQFMPFRELLHLCYGFLDDTGELPIGSTVQHIPNDKVIRVLGISKSLVPHLTSNASYFISLLVTVSFQENNNIPIPHTLLNATVPSPNEHFTLSFFWYAPTKAVYIISNKGPQHLGWQLTLMNVTTALECMCCKDVNMGELLSFLV